MSARDLAGRRWSLCMGVSAGAAIVVAHLAATSALGGQLETKVRRQDGSTVWTETAPRFLADEAGRPRAILGVTRDIDRRRRAEEELRLANVELKARVARRTADLHAALENVRRLQALLPICVVCKKIRDADGTWQPLENYMLVHGDITFSHGLCLDCLRSYETK